MPEVWKPIPGFKRYEASNEGWIRSLWDKNGKKVKKILRPTFPNGNGHLAVGLTKNGTTSESLTRQVHSLILLSFAGPCPEGMECIHQDGDKLNNRIGNLKWGTRSENQQMRVVMNPESYQECGPGKLLKNEVAQIKRLYHVNHYSQLKIAYCFDISHTTVSKIINGHRWPDVKMAEENDRVPLIPKRIWLYDLANEVKISSPFLSMILNDKANPSWVTAKRLAQATDSRPDQWMDGTASERKAMAFKYLGGRR